VVVVIGKSHQHFRHKASTHWTQVMAAAVGLLPFKGASLNPNAEQCTHSVAYIEWLVLDPQVRVLAIVEPAEGQNDSGTDCI